MWKETFSTPLFSIFFATALIMQCKQISETLIQRYGVIVSDRSLRTRVSFFFFSITSTRNHPSRTGLDVFIPLLHNAATAASMRSRTVPRGGSTRWLAMNARILVSEYAKFLPKKSLLVNCIWIYHNLLNYMNYLYYTNVILLKDCEFLCKFIFFSVENRSTVLSTLDISGL